jgi:hypothetical protein
VISNSQVGLGPPRVVVVGASASGLATAEALRRLGYDGHVTVVGNEAHPPYDRPPLSKQILTGELDPGQLPLRGHEEVVVDGDLGARRFVAAYRTGNRLAGIVAVGTSPKALRAWRAAIAARQSWSEAVVGALASASRARRTGPLTVSNLMERVAQHPVNSAAQNVTVVAADAEVAHQLGCAPGLSVLCIDRLYRDLDLVWLELAVNRFRPERCSGRVEPRARLDHLAR